MKLFEIWNKLNVVIKFRYENNLSTDNSHPLPFHLVPYELSQSMFKVDEDSISHAVNVDKSLFVNTLYYLLNH